MNVRIFQLTTLHNYILSEEEDLAIKQLFGLQQIHTKHIIGI
jgi:hypothetical protein